MMRTSHSEWFYDAVDTFDPAKVRHPNRKHFINDASYGSSIRRYITWLKTNETVSNGSKESHVAADALRVECEAKWADFNTRLKALESAEGTTNIKALESTEGPTTGIITKVKYQMKRRGDPKTYTRITTYIPNT